MSAQPTADTDLSPEMQCKILRDIRRVWINARYQTEIELKIQERLKDVLGHDTKDGQHALTDRLREIELAVSTLDEELATITLNP